MLQPRFLIAWIFIFVVLSLMGGIMEGTWIGDTGEVTTLNKVMFWEKIGTDSDWGVLRTVQVGWAFFEGITEMLWFNYAFLDNWVGWTLRITFLGPIVAAIVWGIIVSVIGLVRGALGV